MLSLMRSFYRQITKVDSEPFQDKLGRRLVDVITLECQHKYWREKPLGDFDSSGGKLCDACLRTYLLSSFGWKYGEIMFNIWDKKVRSLLV